MNRLIDTMTDAAIDEYISYLSEVNQKLVSPRQELETLFAPVPASAPHWSDNLDDCDSSTWVLCYLSDDTPEETWHVDWVGSVNHGWYISVAYKNDCDSWKYATPVDLNLRYNRPLKNNNPLNND
jgi:hypothetical protein